MSKPSTSSTTDKSISSVTTRQSDAIKRNIDLVGNTLHQITGAKLPSNRQVLQVFFHNMRFVELDKTHSANLTIDSAVVFWKQARIPTQDYHKCSKKLIKLYDQWRNIGKTQPHRRSNAKKEEVEEFVANLDNLFDIAAADALQSMKNEEDKEFLKMQRQPGRPGCMIGIDMALYGREERSRIRKEKQDARQKKHEEESSHKAGNKIDIHICCVRVSDALFSMLCSCY